MNDMDYHDLSCGVKDYISPTPTSNSGQGGRRRRRGSLLLDLVGLLIKMAFI